MIITTPPQKQDETGNGLFKNVMTLIFKSYSK